jgi:peptidyl-prolyl cis-trans isomerase B (cyclophilin B)
MVVSGTPWGRITRLTLAGVLLGVCLLGCHRRSRPKPTAPAEADAGSAKEAKKSPADARFQAPFAEATRKDPLPDWEPPATTLAGKSVGTLYDQVVKSWDGIRFVGDDGKRLVYHALVETDLGTLDLELRPDWAPNHVRNFIALAKVGYYDGLAFNRIVNQMSKESGDKVELIEGGSPVGSEAGDQDGIGYWLKDEFNPKLPHEEGVVGAGHGDEADSAACKFYIMLCKAPRLDGNYTVFARVAAGLDVARKIAQQPVRKDEDGAEGQEDGQDVVGGDYHPVKPVVIRKVTIQTKEVDKEGPGGDN